MYGKSYIIFVIKLIVKKLNYKLYVIEYQLMTYILTNTR